MSFYTIRKRGKKLSFKHKKGAGQAPFSVLKITSYFGYFINEYGM